MKTFISEQAQIGENRLFIMDNASIHRGELSSIIEASRPQVGVQCTK